MKELNGSRDLPAVLTLLPLHIAPLCQPCCAHTALPETRLQGQAQIILQTLYLPFGGGSEDNSEQEEYSAYVPQWCQF